MRDFDGTVAAIGFILTWIAMIFLFGILGLIFGWIPALFVAFIVGILVIYILVFGVIIVIYFTTDKDTIMHFIYMGGILLAFYVIFGSSKSIFKFNWKSPEFTKGRFLSATEPMVENSTNNNVKGFSLFESLKYIWNRKYFFFTNTLKVLYFIPIILPLIYYFSPDYVKKSLHERYYLLFNTPYDLKNFADCELTRQKLSLSSESNGQIQRSKNDECRINDASFSKIKSLVKNKYLNEAIFE